ncbi:MAG: SDR family NAD(P)-dependent oxidoreductase, partial [Desulfomonilia bacterium]|nr:SDR family NAD(P)-dependent oxidoreductase [Desulfomonilia bacterium]
MNGTSHAVITGAASGLGRDLSIALARKGWCILISDVNTDEAAITLKMVQQAGGSGETYLCDVTSFEQVQTMADYVFGAWGGVDLLVNNAGVAAAGAVGDIS